MGYYYVKEARRRNGVTGIILVQLLEMRLDNICFSNGLATTIAGARQLVNHGHITVNDKVINIPSFQCRLNDVISVKEKSTSKNLVTNNLKVNQRNGIPSHLEINRDQEKINKKEKNE